MVDGWVETISNNCFILIMAILNATLINSFTSLNPCNFFPHLSEGGTQVTQILSFDFRPFEASVLTLLSHLQRECTGFSFLKHQVSNLRFIQSSEQHDIYYLTGIIHRYT